MNDPRVVLDAGVLDLVDSDKEMRSVMRGLVDRGADVVIPTVVLAEAITGRAADASVNRVVKRFGTKDTSQTLARRAGELRFLVERSGARRLPSGIDAIVAAHAAEVGRATVLTTDPSDLRRLLANFPNVAVERP